MLPERKGRLRAHLVPYQWRPTFKNVYDELMQRFFVKDFALHVRYLDELADVHRAFERNEPPLPAAAKRAAGGA